MEFVHERQDGRKDVPAAAGESPTSPTGIVAAGFAAPADDILGVVSGLRSTVGAAAGGAAAPSALLAPVAAALAARCASCLARCSALLNLGFCSNTRLANSGGGALLRPFLPSAAAVATFPSPGRKLEAVYGGEEEDEEDEE